MTDWLRQQDEIRRRERDAYTDGFLAGVLAERDRGDGPTGRLLDRVVANRERRYG